MAATSAIKLFKLASELNMGRDAIVDFLKGKGFDIQNKPTTSLTPEMVDIVYEKFKREKIVAEKQREKLEKHHILRNAPGTEHKPEKDEIPEPEPLEEVKPAPVPSKPEVPKKEVYAEETPAVKIPEPPKKIEAEKKPKIEEPKEVAKEPEVVAQPEPVTPKPIKVEKAETTEKVEKSEKVEKTEKVDKTEKVEKAEKAENIEKVDKVEIAEQAETKAPKVTEKQFVPDAKSAKMKGRNSLIQDRKNLRINPFRRIQKDKSILMIRKKIFVLKVKIKTADLMVREQTTDVKDKARERISDKVIEEKGKEKREISFW